MALGPAHVRAAHRSAEGVSATATFGAATAALAYRAVLVDGAMQRRMQMT